MSLSPFDKTWQFNVNQRFTASGSALTDHRNVLRLGIVNALLGFGSSPWTVIGSSDSAASGMDAVNRWIANSNLVWVNTSGVHSWIVLQQAGVNAKAQWCIDLVGGGISGVSGNGDHCAMFYSPVAGFGTANGGTDGSTSARPTATDEATINTAALGYLHASGVSAPTSRDYLVNIMMSSDGQCTRMFLRRPDVSAYSVMFLFEKPKNPVSGWTNPVVARWHAMTTSAPIYTQWSDTALLNGRAPSGVMTLFMTSEGWSSDMAGQRVTTKNEIANEFELFGMGAASETLGARGRHGRLFDMYWVSTQLVDGHSFPGDESRQLLVVGDMAVPWNGSVPELV